MMALVDGLNTVLRKQQNHVIRNGFKIDLFKLISLCNIILAFLLFFPYKILIFEIMMGFFIYVLSLFYK